MLEVRGSIPRGSTIGYTVKPKPIQYISVLFWILIVYL